jgi:hypothetical protein
MNNNTERDRNPIFIEVPSILSYPCQERIPSLAESIESIYFTVVALRTLASGNVRWWVLISGWLYFDILFVCYTSLLLLLQNPFLLSAPMITVIPLFPLTRGTVKKLSQRTTIE